MVPGSGITSCGRASAALPLPRAMATTAKAVRAMASPVPRFCLKLTTSCKRSRGSKDPTTNGGAVGFWGLRDREVAVGGGKEAPRGTAAPPNSCVIRQGASGRLCVPAVEEANRHHRGGWAEHLLRESVSKAEPRPVTAAVRSSLEGHSPRSCESSRGSSKPQASGEKLERECRSAAWSLLFFCRAVEHHVQLFVAG